MTGRSLRATVCALIVAGVVAMAGVAAADGKDGTKADGTAPAGASRGAPEALASIDMLEAARAWAKQIVQSFMGCCMPSGNADGMLELMTPMLRRRYTGPSGGCTLSLNFYEYASFSVNGATAAPDGREVIVEGTMTGAKYSGKFRIHVELEPDTHHWRVGFLSFEHEAVTKAR